MTKNDTVFLFDLSDHINYTVDWKSIIKDVINNNYNVKEDFENTTQCFIPLFLCNSYDSIRSHGFNIPHEFVFEVGHNYNPKYEYDKENEPQYCCEIVGDSLLKRLELLFELNINRNISKEDIRDWCYGAFRQFMFMDAHVHGTSGTMNIPPKKDEVFWRKWFGDGTENENFEQKKNRIWLRNRFDVNISKIDNETFCCNKDPLLIYKKVLNIIFKKEFEDIKKIFSSNIYNGIKNLRSVLKKMKQKGMALKFVVPYDRLRILVVHDKAKYEAKYLNKHFGDYFIFEELEEVRDNRSADVFFPDVINKIKEKSSPFDIDGKYNKEKALKHYDGILLDLSLGEEPGADLSGYHLIKFFRQLMPTAPVIIYSEHEDMGHIARAFKEDAKWFLKKSETKEKLLRHFIWLKAFREWKEEFNALEPQFDINIDQEDKKFKDRFGRGWKYLTLKCLETLPGHYINIKKLSDGISSAVTFKAQKGVKENQAPVIIKIDSIFNTRMEYERYFRFIRPYIANEAGRVENREILINRDNAAIVYTFTGHRDASHELKTLNDLLRDDLLSKNSCDYEKYRKTFDSLFDEIIPRIHRITPEIEFRDVFEDPTTISKYSDFPNRALGELCPNPKPKGNGNDTWFFSNYTYRMPIAKVITEFNLDTNLDTKEKTDADPYEVSDIGKDKETLDDRQNPENPYKYEIECQHYIDEKIWFEKVILRGYKASFYSRFRTFLLPGSILPITNESIRGIGDIRGVEEKELLSFLLNKNDISITQKKNDTSKSIGGNLKVSRKLSEFIKRLLNIDGGLKNNPLISLRNKLWDWCEEQPERFVSPIGIIHGDLNFKNIMVDSRIHPPKVEKPDVTRTLTDVWLIDFAQTRRDVIAHDFNVPFTAVLPLLLQPLLIGEHKKNEKGITKFIQSYEQKEYFNDLNEKLESFLRHVLFDKFDTAADLFVDDQRLVFIYRILRRIHRAAIDAGLSEDMYLLTTALSCFYSFKIYAKREMPEAAAALVLAGLLCVENLIPEEMRKRWEKEDKKPAKKPTAKK